jgi:CPA1 family monovalent cation:H+ antiporter
MHESATLELVVLVVALMFTASVISLAAKRMRFPFTILLVIIGLALSWASGTVEGLHILRKFRLTPEAVLFVFLPVLLFESAFNLDARRLLKNLAPIAMLAVPALLLSMAVVGGIVHWALGLPIGVALLFGVLISATDPVAVVALFKEIGAPKRLNLLVEGESLFNDGTALVVFKLLLGIIAAGAFTGMTLLKGVASFIFVALGGIAAGIALGFVFSKLISRVYEDRFVEITLTTILAHSSFLLAEHFHVSGVMATVAAGLTMGSYGRLMISPPVLEHLEAFWEYFAFICNSLIFLLVGLSIEVTDLLSNYKAILLAAAAVLIGRTIAVYSTLPVVGRIYRRMEKVSMAFRTVIVWGGLRGALAIVMALSIPHDLPERDFLLTLTLGVVLFSLLVNGLTIRRLMSALGLDNYSVTEKLERAQAMLSVKRSTLDHLKRYVGEHGLNQSAIDKASAKYGAEIARVEVELKDLKSSVGRTDEFHVALRHCLLFERKEHMRLFEEGVLSEGNLRDMLIGIERQLDRIKEGREIYMPGRQPLVGRLESALGRVPLIRPLITRLKARSIAAAYEMERARTLVSDLVLGEIEDLRRVGALAGSALDATRDLYLSLQEKAWSRLKDINASYPEYVEKADFGMIERFCLGREIGEYRELHERGDIPDKALAEVEGMITHKLRSMHMRPVSELLIPPSRLLSMVPLFSKLTADTTDRLASLCSARSFLRGEVVVVEGEEGDSLFIIGRGSVEVTHSTEEGGEHRLATLEAGGFFGETALLHPQPRTATVRTLTPCILLELSRNSIMPVIEDNPILSETLEEAYRTRILNTQLAHIPALADITEEARAGIAAAMQQATFRTGQSMAQKGERAALLFIIKSGRASLTREGGETKFLGPGDSFLDDKAEYSSTLKALTEVEAYTLELGRLREMLREA